MLFIFSSRWIMTIYLSDELNDLYKDVEWGVSGYHTARALGEKCGDNTEETAKKEKQTQSYKWLINNKEFINSSHNASINWNDITRWFIVHIRVYSSDTLISQYNPEGQDRLTDSPIEAGSLADNTAIRRVQ